MGKELAIWISLLVSQGIFFSLMPIWLRLLDYLHPVVIFLVWFCITIFIVYLMFLFTGNTIHISRQLYLGVFVTYTVCLLVLLFFRPSHQAINMIPFKTISYFFSGNTSFLVAFYNLAANILVFIPFGIFAVMMAGTASIPFGMKYGLPILFILLIEVSQFFSKRGTMDIDDIILNVLGVFLGYALTPIVIKVIILS